MEEARYVKVASRSFLAGGKGDDAAASDGFGDRDRRSHFLDACFLCKRDITSDRHIFIYKGDAAFCSDDCRQEQRGMDAALKAARRRHRHRHRLLLRTSSLPASSSSAAAACTANKAAATGNWNIAVGEGFF